MIGAMIGLGCANDLFNLWIWFELMAISSFMLVGFLSQPESCARSRCQIPGAECRRLDPGALRHRPGFHADGTLDLASIRAQATPRCPPGCRRTVHYRLWRQSRVSPLAHLAAGCPFTSAQRHQRHALGLVIESGLVALLRAVGLWRPSAPNGNPAYDICALNMFVGNLLALRQSQ